MKDAKYFTCSTNPQNVFVTYTGGGSRIITELFCVGTSPENAKTIVQKMNGNIVITLGELTDEDVTNLRNGAKFVVDNNGKFMVV